MWNKLEPVVPFEPISTEQILAGKPWVAQIKWDGVRVLTYKDGSEQRLFNRKLKERTYHYPELNASQFCSAKSVILDGEIIALKDGKPSFYEVMKRDGIHNLNKVKFMGKSIPVTYMIFDILYLNEKWVTEYPLSDRQKILEEIIQPSDSIQLMENFDDAHALYDVIQAQGMEGIVLKELTSSYLINGKDERWRKKKNYRDLIAVVGGVTFRGNIVNSLLLGLYDHKGQFWYIGHGGTGKLTHSDWANLTEVIRPLIQENMPFVNTPSRIKDTFWVKPEIAVKVNYIEWIDGHTLRQPSIQSFVDVSAEECQFE